MEPSLAMIHSKQPTILDPLYSTIPAELWLQILEFAAVESAEHTWTTVRLVSHRFENFVERVFTSKVLPTFAISLALPRRDPTSGHLKWPVAIPTNSIFMNFDRLDDTQHYVFFRSASVLDIDSESRTLEELKDSNALPRERLLESPSWLVPKPTFLAGRFMTIPKQPGLDWSEEHKAWVWRIEWRKLLTQFYEAKRKARIAGDEGRGPRRAATRRDRGKAW